MVGEASPFYIIHPEVPQRLHHILPTARIIVLLRNPIDRAYSHYQLMVKRGLEHLSFELAVEREAERLERSGGIESPEWRQFSYLVRGEYAAQLERWYSIIPRERMLVLKSENLYSDPGSLVDEALTYLGLPLFRPNSLKAYHLATYEAMNPSTRQRLTDHFAPLNQRLYALIGRNLGWDDV
jgi:hypothetical protein